MGELGKARTMFSVCTVLWNKKYCILPCVCILICLVYFLQNTHQTTTLSKTLKGQLPSNLRIVFNGEKDARHRNKNIENEQEDNQVNNPDVNQDVNQEGDKEGDQEENQDENKDENQENDNIKENKMAIDVDKGDKEEDDKNLKDYRILPNPKTIDSWRRNQLAFEFYRYTRRVQYRCHNLMSFASTNTWKMCSDLGFQPKENCLVYSFGFTNLTPVETFLSKNLRCSVHYFDPFAKDGESIDKSGVYVHSTGLSAQNGRTEHGWRVRTLFTIMEELGHENRTIDLLKIDMAKWEWNALPEVVRSGALNHVTQLLLAIHMTTEPSSSDYKERLKVFHQMYAMHFQIANIEEKEDALATHLGDKLSKEIEMLFIRVPPIPKT